MNTLVFTKERISQNLPNIMKVITPTGVKMTGGDATNSGTASGSTSGANSASGVGSNSGVVSCSGDGSILCSLIRPESPQPV